MAENSLPQATILRHDTPKAMFVGDTTTVAVVVQNTGGTTWPAQGDVRLAYHWLDELGTVVFYEGLRTMLPSDVAPHETITLQAQVRVLGEPGSYVLLWQMLEEGVAWLDQPADAPPAQASVSVRARHLWDSVPVGPVSIPGRDLARWLIFCLVNVGHLALHLFLGLRQPGSRYARLFEALILCLGSLYVSLSLTVFTTGLSYWRGLAALLIIDVIMVLLDQRLRAADHATSTEPQHPRHAERITMARWLVMLVVISLGLHWLLTASRPTAIPGIDARHYHVPHAIHYANGHSPWGLLPTPHLYPMSSSVLAAWLILPFHDLSLIELTNLPLFILSLAALGELTRLATSAAGWVWGVALGAILLMTPLGQAISPFSADMSYCAFFLTLFALALRVWFAQEITVRDSLLLATATGLLLGCKVSSPVAVATVLGLLVLALVIRHFALRSQFKLPPRLPLLLPGLLVIAVSCGGIWQVRNWIVYGSPLAPSGIMLGNWTLFPGTTYEQTRLYYSILADLQQDPGYPMGAQALLYLQKWLGAGYVWLTLGLLGFMGQVAWLATHRDQTKGALVWPRVVLLIASLAVTGIHLALFVGLPWTSLERGEGLSLRYIMPLLMLLPASMLLGIVPCGLRPREPGHEFWLARTQNCAAIVMLGGLLVGARSAALPWALPELVKLNLDALLMASILVGVVVWSKHSGSALSKALLVAILASTVFLAAQVTTDNHRLAAARQAVQYQQSLEGAPHEMAVAARIIHTDAGGTDQPRRVFLLGRFDYPLLLHDSGYRSVVYDLDPRRLLGIADKQRAAPGDYLVRSLEGDQNWLASQWLTPGYDLVELGSAGNYHVYRLVGEP